MAAVEGFHCTRLARSRSPIKDDNHLWDALFQAFFTSSYITHGYADHVRFHPCHPYTDSLISQTCVEVYPSLSTARVMPPPRVLSLSPSLRTVCRVDPDVQSLRGVWVCCGHAGLTWSCNLFLIYLITFKLLA